LIILGYFRGEPFHKGRPVSYWITQLDTPDNQKAAVALGEMGPQAAPAVPALIRALRSEDRKIWRPSADALGRIGPGAADAGPALVEAIPQLMMMGLSSVPELSSCADLLVSLGPETLPALIQGLQHENPGVRFCVACALARLGPEAKKAIPALIAALQEPVQRKKVRDRYPRVGPQDALNEWSFCQIAMTLGEMGPEARDAVPIILGAIKDGIGPRSVRFTSTVYPTFVFEGEPLSALARMDPDLAPVAQSYAKAAQTKDLSAFQGLLNALRSPNRRVREVAAFALSQLYSFLWDEALAKPAIEELTRALQDEAAEVRWSAAAALVQIGWYQDRENQARLVLPILIEALAKDKEHFLVRLSAVNAIHSLTFEPKVRAQVKKAVPGLLEALNDPVREVRWGSLKALRVLDSIPLGFRQARTTPELGEQVRRAVTILPPERELPGEGIKPATPPPQGTEAEHSAAPESWFHIGDVGVTDSFLPRLVVRQPLPVDLAFCERWHFVQQNKSYSLMIPGFGKVVPRSTTREWHLEPPQKWMHELADARTEPGVYRFTVRITLEPSLETAFYNDLPAYWPGTIELPETTVWIKVSNPAAKPK
jgi:HEAT repeat protein